MSRVRSFHRGPSSGLVIICALLTGMAALAGTSDWQQWGGPQRDFTADSSNLAAHWPETGPHQLWSQPIEYAHSAILVDGDTLYTMCRRGEQDTVLALDADTGTTRWEHRYDAPVIEGMDVAFGPGPHATPLIVGDRLFTIGAMVHLHCLDKETGKVHWSRNLHSEYGATFMGRGYGSSPIAWGDLIIVVLGSPDAGVAAFKQDTGALAWKSQPYRGSYASPLLAKINGEDHVILALSDHRVGLDPATGKTRWSAQVDQQSAAIMSSPMFVPPNRVLFTAAYGGGTRLFEITRATGGYEARELWHCRKFKVHHGNTLIRDGCVYGSSGDFGPAFLMGVDLERGKVKWRERGFAKATMVLAGEHAVILDETGTLALASLSPKGIDIHAKIADVLEEKAWTVPTIAGDRMYIRDYHHIKAFDLSPAANGG